ncbi:MAG: ABC transporter permease, partial [Bryobacteraceae bacterium]|nr:ABC transporter permease [Bryobacteraceae bacterium]
TWGNHWIYATGRLKPGLRAAQAELALRPVSDQLRDQWSMAWGAMRSWRDNPSGWTAALVPISQTRIAPAYRRPVTTFLWMLGGIVGLVLLMACVNVAGLIITRALRRHREIAVRLSLGADRSRIVRQLLIESLLLAGAGCAVGLLIAHWTARFLASFRTPFIPLAIEASLDDRVLVFAVALSILCAVLSGLLPARQASACDLASAMKGDVRGSLSAGRPSRLRGTLVTMQVALSLMFLAGAGLFLRTLMNARAADITVDPGNVLLTQLDLRKRGYDSIRGQLFFDTLLDRLHSLPGVKSAALVLVVPLGGNRGGTNIKTADGEVQVDFNAVSPGYFDTVGIPVLRGRSFTGWDRAESPGVALINEQFASRFFPGQDPVGKLIELTFPDRPKAQVVGIVRDGRFRSVREPVKACFYLPQAQFHWPFYSGH